ncbi:transglutaminase domain-containing protein [Acetobacteraceae bacterium H6797]|nr:transglutaminase domain-containing protein [Acetobacteraceae bacterium H6797]
MLRRALLSSATLALAAAGTLACPSLASAQTTSAARALPGWRRFSVTSRVTIPDEGAAQLYLPLAQTAGGYQASADLKWQTNGSAAVVQDDHYGADILRVSWDGKESGPKSIDVVQIVAACDRRGASALLPVTSAERAFWLEPTESVPVDGIVGATAQRIVGNRTDPKEKLRALYDWVVDNTSRNPETPGCGFGDVKAMLESGNLSGKCADINGLMTALARGAGLPARDVYGIRVANSRYFRTMGASGVISKAQHCRSEVYLEGQGWFPVDPADVRKVILDHKLDPKSAEIADLREKLFGMWEMNWVGYNSATDIRLPGAAAQQKPNFAFLMYPCAFTSAGQPDCLDPARFQYEITAREEVA